MSPAFALTPVAIALLAMASVGCSRDDADLASDGGVDAAFGSGSDSGPRNGDGGADAFVGPGSDAGAMDADTPGDDGGMPEWSVGSWSTDRHFHQAKLWIGEEDQSWVVYNHKSSANYGWPTTLSAGAPLLGEESPRPTVVGPRPGLYSWAHPYDEYDLALDSAGAPCVVYDTDHLRLKCQQPDGEWGTGHYVAEEEDSDQVAMALGPDGQFHIVFVSGGMKYRNVSPTPPEPFEPIWGEAFDSQPIWRVEGPLDVAVDSRGRVHVAYVVTREASSVGANDVELRYALRTEGGWNVDVLDEEPIANHNRRTLVSMALESEGSPQIAYLAGSAQQPEVRLLARRGGEWVQTSIAESWENVERQQVKLQIGPGGVRHVAYPERDQSTDDDRIVHASAAADSSSWAFERVPFELEASSWGHRVELRDMRLGVDGLLHVVALRDSGADPQTTLYYGRLGR